ncbi:unnamed protein product [marine sediment metagenome]|uniref:Uncharacterized protein n=1 Tax=marine sediment metagenome TaxID=412755 RepID=X1S327_9ZZZZ
MVNAKTFFPKDSFAAASKKVLSTPPEYATTTLSRFFRYEIRFLYFG